MECPDLWERYSEFFDFKNCVIFKTTDVGFRLFEIIISCGIFIFECFILYKRRKLFQRKKILSKFLLIVTLFINLILLLRPLIGIATLYRSVNNIIVYSLTNLTVSLVADITFSFILFEISLLYNLSMKAKYKNWLYTHRNILISILIITQTILHIGSVIIFYLHPNIGVSYEFWLPTIITTMVSVPILSMCGLNIYNRMKQVQNIVYKELATKFILILIIYAILGSFVFMNGVILFFLNGVYTIEWMFLEFYWIAIIIQCCCIFSMVILKKSRITSRNPREETDEDTNEKIDSKIPPASKISIESVNKENEEENEEENETSGVTSVEVMTNANSSVATH